MNKIFNYPHKTRNDFLQDIVKAMVKRRKDLGITQEDLNYDIGVADRLLSKWECGARTPTSFHLYYWADALNGRIAFISNDNTPRNSPIKMQKSASNDNNLMGIAVNDNCEDLKRRKLKIA